METIIPGGWTTFTNEISEEANAMFKKAFNGLIGVAYEPVAVATQVVSGIKYSFFCNAKGIYPNARNQAAIVDIYQAPNGVPTITQIKMLDQ